MARTKANRSNRGSKQLKTAAAALTAAGTIAASTQAYAVPVRFEGLGGTSTNQWRGIGIDVTKPADQQPGNTALRSRVDYSEDDCAPGGQTVLCDYVVLYSNGADVLYQTGALSGSGSGGFIKSFNAGQMISGSTGWGAGWLGRDIWENPGTYMPGDYCFHNPYCAVIMGQTLLNTAQFYVAAKIQLPTGTHFGWIKGAWSSGAPVQGVGVSRPNIIAWGYETEPNTPIAAGAVPEPGTLALLAFGATAVASRRRKQKA